MLFDIDYVEGKMKFDGVALRDMDETQQRRVVMLLYFSLRSTEVELKAVQKEVETTSRLMAFQFLILFIVFIFETFRVLWGV
jgi:hypothetical protein